MYRYGRVLTVTHFSVQASVYYKFSYVIGNSIDFSRRKWFF